MPDRLERLATEWVPTVCRITVATANGPAGVGTGFFTAHGLVTAKHVLAPIQGDHRVAVTAGGDTFETSGAELRARILIESGENDHDFALLSTEGIGGALEDRGEYKIEAVELPPLGRRVAYLGFPFGTDSIVVSNGYVSSVEQVRDVDRIRVDGSINRGNSGGPLLDVERESVVAVVTRAETGYVKQQMDQLQKALNDNVALLRSQAGTTIQIGAVDVMGALQASQVAMANLASHIERSANVGIGYGFGINRLANLLARGGHG